MRRWLSYLALWLLAVGAVLGGTGPARAQESLALEGPWQRDNDMAVRLLSSVLGVGAQADVLLALEVDMQPQWHIYWRSPGPMGLPPQVNWTASQTGPGNLDRAILLYPAPHRFGDVGFESAGYAGHVVLPIKAHLKKPGKPLRLNATVDLLACSTLCVPKNFTLTLEVPEGPANPSPHQAEIQAALASVPDLDGRRYELKVLNVERAPEHVTVTLESPVSFEDPQLFVENPRDIFFGAPSLVSKEGGRAVFRLKPVDPLPSDVKLGTLPLTITVVDGPRSAERALDPSVMEGQGERMVAQAALNSSSGPGVLLFVLLALVGGFILNLMPCVLPVLSLKILSVIGHGGGECKTVRRSFVVTAAGILFSFLLLAGAMVSFKAMGRAVGWGLQFQQPAFLVFLILLLTLFAANLWDLFEIALPHWMADKMDPAYHPKLAGDFFTGAFATLLATPCSAPFLGTAIGFALAAGTFEIFAIFAALGIGMATPYLAVALWPRLATALPRPGRWMQRLCRALGGLLALTAVWLIYVLFHQIALFGTVSVALCMAGILLALMAHKTAREKQEKAGLFSSLPLVVGLLAAIAFGASLSAGVKASLSLSANETAWQPFDEAVLAQEVRNGKTVFVDITADWCVNCKVNKHFVLERDHIRRCLLQGRNIVAMRADWTASNAVVASFLKSHGRYGIPFNAVFGPALPQGMVLPEILTPSSVQDALAKASGAQPAC